MAAQEETIDPGFTAPLPIGAYTTPALVAGKSKLENECDFDAWPFIREAAARIDTKLRRRYQVPLREPVPPLIVSIATNFAAGFAIERDYSNRREQDEPYLAEVLIKRAEDDLQEILELDLLAGLEGVAYAPSPQPQPSERARPALASTTPQCSEMERALQRW